ncbi:MAG: molybdenum cofactor biosysynthesis protein [Devosia sp.]|uniref:MOSC domain-containing protein n=1 Tax=Devosia sp. TaxID=1871048 RepID=UPI00261B03F6|nr:MOSC domain-containing protein [Devosia sp.]MDB5528467.1 molybdenum cofactor biosysynthesis protein [Devosia sp.]
MSGRVVSVSLSARHNFSKDRVQSVRLLQGLGIEGDAHAGVTVQHRSRVAVDPSQPNLRQVHLIHAELFDELTGKGFAVVPGDLGENIATAGIDLLALPRGTVLRLGAEAVVQVTGLRNPCSQIEAFQPGLLANVIGKDDTGEIVRKAGIMSIVLAGGVVHEGDVIAVEFPALPYLPLERV